VDFVVTAGDYYNMEVADSYGRLLASVSSKGVHKKVLLNGILGGVSWRPDELAVAWIAEPKSKPYKLTDGNRPLYIHHLFITCRLTSYAGDMACNSKEG
jgi:hypothetical protein